VRLLVIGNAAVDRCFRVDRLPREGESVLAAVPTVEPGGKGLNQAVMAARTGAEVTLLAVLGSDAAGAMLRRHLGAEGLGGPWLLEHAGPSDESIVLVGPSGDNLIVTTHAAAEALPPATALEAIADLAPGDSLLMQGNLAERTTVGALAAARARGVRTLFNPSPLRPGTAAALDHVDILIANVPEAAALAKSVVPVTITTLGAAGARLTTAGGSRRIAAPAVTAVDTTGAGDVLAGVLAGRLTQGGALETALGIAVRAASLKVARAGTAAALPSAAELRALGASGPVA
jgi:ribokinase